MTEFSFVVANLLRKKVRTALLLVSVFVAFAIFGVLSSFEEAFNRPSDLAAENRLITANRISFTQPMPVAYVNRIAGIPGVERATGANWFGGFFQEPRNSLVALSVDPESYLEVYASDVVVAPAERAKFIADRSTMLVGETLANRYGWKVGDRVPIGSSLYANRSTGKQSWDFEIAGILRPRTTYADTNYLIFHDQLFNETRNMGRDTVTWIMVTTTDPARNEEVTRAVDAAFANSTAETNTDTEKAFNRAFAAQFGDIALMVRLVVGAAMITILMIVGNTMIGAIRERGREIAVLKTLGFTASRIFRIILSEAMLIALVGGLLGFLAATVVLQGLGPELAAIAPGLSMTPRVLLMGLALMLALGLVTGLLPAWNAIRTNIAAAFRRD